MKKKMKKLDIKALKEVIFNLADGFDKKHIESQIFKHILDNAEYLVDPDKIHTMITFPFERCLELAISQTQNQAMDIVSLWLAYDFLETNVSKLCSQFYGRGCSVDRGRFIVKSYIKFKKTGKMPKLDWKQKYTFHYPNSGTLKQWFAFVEGVDRLRYGYNKEYLIALNELIKSHKKKQNEIKNKTK